jgi:hypothetical protein
MDKSQEFIGRLVMLCAEYDARIFARSDDSTSHISVVFGATEDPWLDFKRVNATEGAVKSGH